MVVMWWSVIVDGNDYNDHGREGGCATITATATAPLKQEFEQTRPF